MIDKNNREVKNFQVKLIKGQVQIMNLHFLIIFFAIFILRYVFGSLFTSVHRMESALRKDLPDFISHLDSYLTEEERRIEDLKCVMKDMKNLERNLLKVIETTDLEGDPLTYFKFASSFTTNWDKIENSLNAVKSKILEYTIRSIRTNLPTEEDKTAIIDGIERMQTTFNLSVSDLANGRILDRKSVVFSASECYGIANRLYTKSLHRSALMWVDAAIAKLHNSNQIVKTPLESPEQPSLEQLQKLKQEAESMYKRSWNHLNKTIQEAIAMGPKMGLTDKRINNAKEIKKKFEEGQIRYVGEEVLRNLDQYQSYEQLCQGIIPPYTGDRAKTMTCFFAPHSHPFYKLRRVKVEIMTKSPLIMILHDVVYDSEIDVLKDMVLDNLRRSRVRSGFKKQTSDTRISESAFISSTSWIALKLDGRFRTMLGLNFSRDVTERYKVSNYGPAGVFNMHVDFLKSQEEIHSVFRSKTNRLFSLLAYLSNVEYGGNTAFPLLGVSITPIKGSMLIFQNVLEDGTGDMRSLHGSCPMVLGSKWISAKYVHFAGQNLTTIKRLAHIQ